MRKLFVCITLALSLSATPMSRVIAVHDSRSITVDTNGRKEKVTLRGVEITPDHEAIAVEYLRGLIGRAWVLVEHGDVYRSPDGLFVNGEMRRHAWRTSPSMKYLGELDLGVRAKGQSGGNKPAKQPELAPPAKTKQAPRGITVSRSGSQRSARPRSNQTQRPQ